MKDAGRKGPPGGPSVGREEAPKGRLAAFLCACGHEAYAPAEGEPQCVCGAPMKRQAAEAADGGKG